MSTLSVANLLLKPPVVSTFHSQRPLSFQHILSLLSEVATPENSGSEKLALISSFGAGGVYKISGPPRTSRLWA